MKIDLDKQRESRGCGGYGDNTQGMWLVEQDLGMSTAWTDLVTIPNSAGLLQDRGTGGAVSPEGGVRTLGSQGDKCQLNIQKEFS